MGAGKGFVLSWMSRHGYFPLEDIVHVDPDHFKRCLPEWEGYTRTSTHTAGDLCHRESCFLQEVAQEVRGVRGRRGPLPPCTIPPLERAVLGICRQVAMKQLQNVWVDGSLRDGAWYAQEFKSIRRRFPRYKIAIFEIGASEAVVRERVAKRAAETGRDVPEHLIRESLASVASSLEILMPLCAGPALEPRDLCPRLCVCVCLALLPAAAHPEGVTRSASPGAPAARLLCPQATLSRASTTTASSRSCAPSSVSTRAAIGARSRRGSASRRRPSPGRVASDSRARCRRWRCIRCRSGEPRSADYRPPLRRHRLWRALVAISPRSRPDLTPISPCSHRVHAPLSPRARPALSPARSLIDTHSDGRLLLRKDHPGLRKVAGALKSLSVSLSAAHAVTLKHRSKAACERALIPENAASFAFCYPAAVDWNMIDPAIFPINDADDTPSALALAGAFVYFDEAGLICAVNAVRALLDEYADAADYHATSILQFAAPLPLPDSAVKALQGRTRPVTFATLLSLGATHFAWLKPSETLPGLQILPPSGAFAYLFKAGACPIEGYRACYYCVAA